MVIGYLVVKPKKLSRCIDEFYIKIKATIKVKSKIRILAMGLFDLSL